MANVVVTTAFMKAMAMIIEALQRCWPQSHGVSVSRPPEHVQRLWNGYGDILRLSLQHAPVSSVIVKYIDWHGAARAADAWCSCSSARLGWQSQSPSQRQRSYQAESAFYQHFASRADAACRVPTLLFPDARAQPASNDRVDMDQPEEDAGVMVLLLEDLDAAGFQARPRSLGGIGTSGMRLYCTGWRISMQRFSRQILVFGRAVPTGIWQRDRMNWRRWHRGRYMSRQRR